MTTSTAIRLSSTLLCAKLSQEASSESWRKYVRVPHSFAANEDSAKKKSKATSSTPSTNQKAVPAAGKPKGVAKSRAKAAPKQGARRKGKEHSTKEVAKEEPRGFKDLPGGKY
jgi:hypothetical protein